MALLPVLSTAAAVDERSARERFPPVPQRNNKICFVFIESKSGSSQRHPLGGCGNLRGVGRTQREHQHHLSGYEDGRSFCF